jgi:hypothetical protein
MTKYILILKYNKFGLGLVWVLYGCIWRPTAIQQAIYQQKRISMQVEITHVAGSNPSADTISTSRIDFRRDLNPEMSHLPHLLLVVSSELLFEQRNDR